LANHTREVGCDHHHADSHVDHPEDHVPAPVHVHEKTHGHEDHVHSPGCGHVGHEQANASVDRHTHTEHCGHVGHEDAHEHVDECHVHDQHCGHAHHRDVQAYVDDVDTALGHSHTSGERMDHTEGHPHKPVHTVHEHSEAVQPSSTQREIVEQTQVAAEAEAMARHKVESEVQTLTKHTPAAPVFAAHEVINPAILVDKAAQAQPLATLAHKLADTLISMRGSTSVDVTQEDSDATSHSVEILSTSSVELETSSATQVVDVAQTYESTPFLLPETDLPVGPLEVAKPSLDPIVSPEEWPVSDEIMIAAIPEEARLLKIQPDVTTETVANVLLDNLNLDLAAFSTREQRITTETSTLSLTVSVENSDVDRPDVVSSVTTASEQPLGEAIKTLVSQYDDIEERLALTTPERLQTMHAVIYNLKADVHTVQEKGTLPDTIQTKVIQLLDSLGFENASQTLQSYIQQYGIRFLDELLSRFLELFSRGRSFEHLRTLQSQPITRSQTTGVMAVLGTIALQLLRPGTGRLEFLT